MTIASYSDLTGELSDWLNRADLSAKVPTFIQLFETRMNRRLRDPDQVITATQTIVSGQNVYPINDPMREVSHVYLDATPRVELIFMSFENLRRWYTEDNSDIPQAYAIVGDQIVLQPIPTSGTLNIIGYSTIPALNDSNPTNWLLTDHPDAYLYGSLCEAAVFLGDDERVSQWKSAWDEIMGEIMDDGNSSKIPSGPVQSRPAVWE